MPGISIRGIDMVWASGTGRPRSPSHARMVAISSCCALMIREASVRTDGLAPWVGAQAAITRACAWWPIMSDMKRTSASVYGRRTLSARTRAADRVAASPATGWGDGSGAAPAAWPQAVMAAVAASRAAGVQRRREGVMTRTLG
jgi:hypothetical protein